MNVSLTPEHERYVKKKVGSGLYASASEVVREGLRLLQEQDQLKSARLDEFRKQVEAGMAAAEAGLLVDGPSVIRALKKRVRRSQSGTRLSSHTSGENRSADHH
jgi:antitoxin ParD1/3/4